MRTYVTTVMAGVVCCAMAGAAEVELNGLRIALDDRNGAITKLEFPGAGVFLEADPDRASILDVAYPTPGFEPLRLAARYSEGVRIEASEGEVRITWTQLGASRDWAEADGVWAQVRLREATDGASIVTQCVIDNRSDRPVRQVLFPDLMGLQPFDGPAKTQLRTGGFSSAPFQTMPAGRLDGGWYAPAGVDRIEYTGGAAFTPMVTRWADFGGVGGGLSMFPQVWMTPHSRLRLHRAAYDGSLRVMYAEDVTIEPGQRWESPEYVLTPHAHGWAEGIRPYRRWVEANVERLYPMAQHVREGLGYRTVWLCQGFPADGRHDVNFRYTELPALARDAKEHGLDEMVLWFWGPFFTVHMDDMTFEHLGTEAEFRRAIEECQAMGVNVSLFVSWVALAKDSAERFGLEVPATGWTYHPDLVPRWDPPYATGYATAGAPFEDERWQRACVENYERMLRKYSPSLSWDQILGTPEQTGIYSVLRQIRELQRAASPEATLSGETTYTTERDANLLDYTWDWFGYRDFRPYTNSFPAPRFNCVLNRDIQNIYKAFADNLYLNAMPAKPGGPNATAYIKDYPAVSEAYKRCAKLRAQFLPYFTGGEMIADCILTAEPEGVHVTAYALPDSVLMIVYNPGAPFEMQLPIELAPWLEPGERGYEAVIHNGEGDVLERRAVPRGVWREQTPLVAQNDLLLYVFSPAE